MEKYYKIAIDGPAASGKSTTAKSLAQKLGYIYIDTGAMYRACALRSLQDNINLSDKDQLKKMLENIKIDIKHNKNGNRILLDDVDVTQRIRENDITRKSSEIAIIPQVREKMVELQREIGKNGGVVMDGRDIGTVVFPDADFKFFMDAKPEIRAQRRLIENQKRGISSNYNEILKELKWRDQNDSKRKIAPLKKANDAILIDTSNLTIKQQVERIMEIIRKDGN